MPISAHFRDSFILSLAQANGIKFFSLYRSVQKTPISDYNLILIKVLIFIASQMNIRCLYPNNVVRLTEFEPKALYENCQIFRSKWMILLITRIRIYFQTESAVVRNLLKIVFCVYSLMTNILYLTYCGTFGIIANLRWLRHL